MAKRRTDISVLHSADGDYVVEFREYRKIRPDIITAYLVQPDEMDGERRGVWIVEHANPQPEDGGPYRVSKDHCGCKGNVCRHQQIVCRHQRMVEEVILFRDRESRAKEIVRALLGQGEPIPETINW